MEHRYYYGSTTAPTRPALSPVLVQGPSLDRYTIYNDPLNQRP